MNVNNSQLSASVSAASALCEGVNMTVSVGGVVHLCTGEKKGPYDFVLWQDRNLSGCSVKMSWSVGGGCLKDVTSSQQMGCQWESPLLSGERWHQDRRETFNI